MADIDNLNTDLDADDNLEVFIFILFIYPLIPTPTTGG